MCPVIGKWCLFFAHSAVIFLLLCVLLEHLLCIKLCVCVCLQGVFDHRMKTWQKWQDSQMLLQKKREAEAKLQFTNKPDKLQQAKDEIKEVR